MATNYVIFYFLVVPPISQGGDVRNCIEFSFLGYVPCKHVYFIILFYNLLTKIYIYIYLKCRKKNDIGNNKTRTNCITLIRSINFIHQIIFLNEALFVSYWVQKFESFSKEIAMKKINSKPISNTRKRLRPWFIKERHI